MKGIGNEVLEKLLAQSPYSLSDTEKIPLLKQALAVELIHHVNNCKAIKRFYEKRGFSPQRDFELSDIPFLTTEAFKDMGTVLISVDSKDVKSKLYSSATSGVSSIVHIDALTAERQSRAMTSVISQFIGSVRRPFYIIDLNPILHPRSLGAREAAVIGYMRFASTTQFFGLRAVNGMINLDTERLLEELRLIENAQPVVIFGFTYILFQHVIRPFYQQNIRLTLPIGTKLLHIGGWKKLKDEDCSKERFNTQALQVFGLDPSCIIDIYGFTEQMGMNYPDCTEGLKHTPCFGEVLVRDPVGGQILPDGELGTLQFLSPIPHSYPGNSILTDDMGKIVRRGKCGCGRMGTSFVVTGRLPLAETRGCGDIMADKLINVRSDSFSYSTNVGSAKVLLHRGQVGTDDLPISPVASELRERSEWLSRVPVDALIELWSQVCLAWAKAPQFAHLQKQGLLFLSQWCKVENLRALLDHLLLGNRAVLDGFIPYSGSTKKRAYALPRGLAVHWISGNVPLIGMFLLVQSSLTKNLNILKVPSVGGEAIPELLTLLREQEVKLPSGFVLSGAELLDTISVVYFDRNDPAGLMLSSLADIRVAWGGRESIEAISTYPKQYFAEDLFLGPKLSFMVIAREALDHEKNLTSLVRSAATDCSVFDQYGCSSPHTIFVERGGAISPSEFATRLAGEMEQALLRIPKGPVEAGTARNIIKRRVTYELMHQLWCSKELDWTVLYDEERGLATPCYSRVITVRPIDDISEPLQYVTPEIQTVGLSAPGKRGLFFAEEAARRGVMRLPEIGKMTHFDIPWDGFIPVNRLVRWVSMGGPII